MANPAFDPDKVLGNKICNMDKQELAVNYFSNGYNCAQSVVVAFSDVTGLDEKFSAKMVSNK